MIFCSVFKGFLGFETRSPCFSRTFTPTLGEVVLFPSYLEHVLQAQQKLMALEFCIEAVTLDESRTAALSSLFRDGEFARVPAGCSVRRYSVRLSTTKLSACFQKQTWQPVTMHVLAKLAPWSLSFHREVPAEG